MEEGRIIIDDDVDYDHSSGMESSELFSQDAHSKKKSVASLHNGRRRLNISSG
ncbi:hypothetical protein RYX36_023093, partial [Vicia faba]